MLAIEFEPLSALGLTPALANRAVGLAVGADATRVLRITAVHRSTVDVRRRCRARRPGAAATHPHARRRGTRSRWATGCSPRGTHGRTWIAARVPPSSIARRDGEGRIRGGQQRRHPRCSWPRRRPIRGASGAISPWSQRRDRARRRAHEGRRRRSRGRAGQRLRLDGRIPRPSDLRRERARPVGRRRSRVISGAAGRWWYWAHPAPANRR